MNRLLITAGCVFLLSCSDQSHSEVPNASDTAQTLCMFSFEGIEACRVDIGGQPTHVNIEMGPATDDERALVSVTLKRSDSLHRLKISEDVTIIDGDRGYIQFEDINFDGIKDMAVTTSFGVANLHLDYWIYTPEDEAFKYVGNYPSLTPDEETQTLESRIRQTADSYDHSTWVWQQGELVPADR